MQTLPNFSCISIQKITIYTITMPTDYDPELYWDEVAEHINKRDDLKTVAGDDEPY
jgi:hypothetical protein